MGLLAVFQGGAGGLGPAAPVDFATLVLPGSPNWCLAAPAGDGRAQIPLAPFAVAPAVLWAAVRRLGEGVARTTPWTEWPERLQAQWVVRSAVLNFPDIVVAEVGTGPAGARLHLYSRSVFGYSDLGVNRARVEAWLATLATRLPA